MTRSIQSTSPSHRRGLQAILAAATSLAGLVLVVHPESSTAQAISNGLPVVGDVLPALMAAFGTIVAAFSKPPRVKKA